jgi:hypothetical protein
MIVMYQGTTYPPVPGGASQPAVRRPTGWTAARIVSVVIGAVLALCSLGLLGTGGFGLWADTTQRHSGYLDLDTASYSTTGYALAGETVVRDEAGGSHALQSLFGTVRLQITSPSATPIFAGITTRDAAHSYLTGVQYATFRDTAAGARYTQHSGTAPTMGLPRFGGQG